MKRLGRGLAVGFLVILAALVLRWDGALKYPEVQLEGRVFSASDSLPRRHIPVRTSSLDGRERFEYVETDSTGAFFVSIPLGKLTQIEVGGRCLVPILDTLRFVMPWARSTEIVLQPHPGGRPEEHVVCPAQKELDARNRPVVMALLADPLVQHWIRGWSTGRTPVLATTSLAWGSRLEGEAEVFDVVEPAGFGVTVPSDGTPLLDFYFERVGEDRACALLRGFLFVPAEDSHRGTIQLEMVKGIAGWEVRPIEDWRACRLAHS